MTLETIHRELIATRKELREIRAMLVRDTEVWISEKEAAMLISMSVANIRKLRYAGKIENWRVRPTGRGVQYLKSSLQNQFISNK